MGRAILIAAGLLCLASGAGAKSCLRNGTGAPLFLAVDTGHDRQTGWRNPGAWLCAAGEGWITVSAFLSDGDLEGCSRRVEGGGTVAILDYQGVDLCLWSE